jgi:CRISPR-associated protein (TIGR02584 family)
MTWLIASMGTSPSVLTEALWYLEKKKGLSVDGLTCVGTQASKVTAEEKLFSPGGALERLRRILGKPDHWLTEKGGVSWEMEALQSSDNRDLEEARAMDRAFRRAIRNAQESEEHEGPVIACISGGRKTMSGSLQQAMALLARSEDWAFHVLLNTPEGISEQAVINSGFGFPEDPAHPEYLQVGVDAFEAPLVRLREFATNKRIDLADEALVERLQKAVQESVVLPKATLALGTLTLTDEAQPGSHLQLTPQHALLMAAFILAGEPMTMDRAEKHLERVLDLWRTLGIDENSKGFPASLDELEKVKDRWVDPPLTADGSVDTNLFDSQRSRLNKELLKVDPNWHHFQIKGRADLNGAPEKGLRGFSNAVYKSEGRLIRVSL